MNNVVMMLYTTVLFLFSYSKILKSILFQKKKMMMQKAKKKVTVIEPMTCGFEP